MDGTGSASREHRSTGALSALRPASGRLDVNSVDKARRWGGRSQEAPWTSWRGSTRPGKVHLVTIPRLTAVLAVAAGSVLAAGSASASPPDQFVKRYFGSSELP